MRCLICVSLGDADPSPRPERLVVDNGCKGMNRLDHGPETNPRSVRARAMNIELRAVKLLQDVYFAGHLLSEVDTLLTKSEQRKPVF